MVKIFDVSTGPKSISEAHDATSIWELAKEEYPADRISHYFYLISYVIVAYGFAHLLIHLMCKGCNKRYLKLNKKKQGEYRATIISFIHSIICVLFATSAMFYVCGDGQSVFNNEHCLETPRYLHIWALVNSCGYFIADTFNIVVIIGTFDVYDKQMIGHHVIATVTFMGTLAFMNFAVVFGVMLLFVEVSTPFISLRWILYTHKQHRSTCHVINAIMVFFTFLLGRLVFQIGILFGIGYPKLIDMFQDETLPWYKVSLVIIMFISITISALMNLFWMYLIVH